MLFSTHALALLAASIPVMAQLSKYPECIRSCITNNSFSSFCDGDESGQDLDKCTCESLVGVPMIKCMQDCPVSNQALYAAKLPAMCRNTLFPAVKPGDIDSDPSATTTAGTGSGADGGPTKTGEATPESSSPDAGAALSVPGVLAAGGLMAALFL